MLTQAPIPRRVLHALALTATLAAVVGPPAHAQETDRAAYIRENYSKFEHRIPMRDGVKLFTAVYVPNHATEPLPIMLFRTPYDVGPYGADRYADRLGPHEAFEREGFIFALQDVRGTYMSEGTFVNMTPHVAARRGDADADESTDTWDTVEWLVSNIEGNNGRVGQWGISYPGFYAAAGMIDSHPALAAVSPQAPIADWYWDDFHHNGAFTLSMAFSFFSRFGQARPEPTTESPERPDRGTPDGYQFFLDLGPLRNVNDEHFHGEIEFWNQIAAHPDYDDFWSSRNILPHLRNISAAVLVVGGWYDTEDLYGPLKVYQSVERHNPDTSNTIVMGPWVHGGWVRTEGDSLGPIEFGFRTSEYYQKHVDLPFFRHHLKDGPDPALPEALVFETGANRWRTFDAWPPPGLEPRRLFLAAGGALVEDAPTDDDGAADAYVSDPRKPVPYTNEITSGWSREYMTEDQRFAARRPDVLVYRTPALEEDVTIAGPIAADLWVSTSEADADFIVKVIDVFPDRLPGYEPGSGEPDLGGYQRLVRAEVMRGRYRDGFERPVPFVADEPASVSFELLDVLHTFKRGHRIMVQVQSTWFPFIDRNPQSWVPNIFEADADDFVAATHRIHRSRSHPSSVLLGVLEGDAAH